MPNPMENNLMLYYLSGLGGAIGGEGSIAAEIGGITKQHIATKSYMGMIKELLKGGAKVSMDKDTTNIKAPTSLFGDKGVQLPGAQEGLGRIEGVPTPTPPVINPSASPLDIGGAGLAGLTPQDITQALQLKFGAEEIRRKTIADISEATYRETAIRKMEVETEALTPSIEVPGFGKLTRKEALSWYKTTSRDERTAAKKNYDEAVNQGYEGTFETWLMSLAKAAGGIPEFAAKRRIGKEIDVESKLAGPDFPQTVREDLMKDKSTWGYPPMYESFILKGYDEATAIDLGQKSMTIKEMDSRIRSFYKGKKVERRRDGWYVDGELKVRNPYGGD